MPGGRVCGGGGRGHRVLHGSTKGRRQPERACGPDVGLRRGLGMLDIIEGGPPCRRDVCPEPGTIEHRLCTLPQGRRAERYPGAPAVQVLEHGQQTIKD
jgi:hypothetical protein